MPQISCIKYADVLEARRYDAEYFKPEYLEIEEKLQSKNYLCFDEFSFITDGIHNSIDFDEKSDVLLFSAKAPKENFFDISGLSHISEIQHKQNPRTALKEGDVIISTVGTIGNCAVITKDLLPANSDRHVGIIRSKNIPPFFISTFLLSKYGRMQSSRNVVGNVQPNLYIRDMKKFKIPILPQSFQLQIEQIVKSAHQKQTQSKKLYREAEELLLAELGLLDYQVKHSLWFTTTKNEVSEAHRYDSEYFQPKYAEIIKKIEKYDGGWDLVKNTVKFKDKNHTPKRDQKYKYLALSNISSQGYIQDYQEEFGKDLPSRARRKINTNDLIISSIEGSLSSCALVEKEFDDSICSTGFFVLNSEKINSETLLILFKSLVIQELLQRGSKGTILTAISKTELELIKIPLINQSIQNQIAEKIQESHKLRKESKELLEEAKRKVEEEIEK
ncbi:MAG: restriction endonuclease subunit S [Patescibacteria group bacterium]